MWINSGSKQNIEHDYDQIYDMFDLSRILRISVLGIPGWSFDDNNSLNNNDKQREEVMIWNTQNRVSGGWFGSSSTSTFMPQVLFYIGWPLEFPIISLMGHPDIHSLSPYQLINYPIRNLIAILHNLITNQLRLTIDK